MPVMAKKKLILPKTPVVILNMKAYSQAMGPGAVRVAKAFEAEAKRVRKGRNVAVAATALDLRLVADHVKMPVMCQHAESLDPGSRTGHVLLENVKLAKGSGVLINHSECRVEDWKEIHRIIHKAKALGLFTVVCAKDPKETALLAKYGPDFVAVEPPELIGSGISVSTAQPEIVSDAVNLVKKGAPNVKVLCGAGISSGADVKKAIELGADGVLLASYIAKSKRPRKEAKDILSGIL